MILRKLHAHIEGTLELSPTQIQAARILLNKTAPDLKAIEYKGTIDINTDPKALPNDRLLRIINGTE